MLLSLWFVFVLAGIGVQRDVAWSGAAARQEATQHLAAGEACLTREGADAAEGTASAQAPGVLRRFAALVSARRACEAASAALPHADFEPRYRLVAGEQARVFRLRRLGDALNRGALVQPVAAGLLDYAVLDDVREADADKPLDGASKLASSPLVLLPERKLGQYFDGRSTSTGLYWFDHYSCHERAHAALRKALLAAFGPQPRGKPRYFLHGSRAGLGHPWTWETAVNADEGALWTTSVLSPQQDLMWPTRAALWQKGLRLVYRDKKDLDSIDTIFGYVSV